MHGFSYSPWFTFLHHFDFCDRTELDKNNIIFSLISLPFFDTKDLKTSNFYHFLYLSLARKDLFTTFSAIEIGDENETHFITKKHTPPSVVIKSPDHYRLYTLYTLWHWISLLSEKTIGRPFYWIKFINPDIAARKHAVIR